MPGSQELLHTLSRDALRPSPHDPPLLQRVVAGVRPPPSPSPRRATAKAAEQIPKPAVRNIPPRHRSRAPRREEPAAWGILEASTETSTEPVRAARPRAATVADMAASIFGCGFPFPTWLTMLAETSTSRRTLLCDASVNLGEQLCSHEGQSYPDGAPVIAFGQPTGQPRPAYTTRLALCLRTTCLLWANVDRPEGVLPLAHLKLPCQLRGVLPPTK